MDKNRIIITFDGTEAKRSDCKYIKGAYYKKDVQCFLMEDGKWHRIDNGKILFDHEVKKYVLKEGKRFSYGLVEIKNDKLIFGHFSSISYKNCNVYCHVKSSSDRGSYKCIDDSIVKNSNLFVEDLSGNTYIYKKYISDFYSNSKSVAIKGIRSRYSRDLDYKASYRMDEYIESHKKAFKVNKNKTSFHEDLPNISYGVEFETYNGMIPEYKTLQVGLIPVRDGSLRHDGIHPFEYATIPHFGFEGLEALKESCKLLKKYCVNSHLGSTHIHIGSKPVTKEYAVSIFMVMKKLENEIYSLFPEAVRHTGNFKGKDYCNPLPKLNMNKLKSLDENFNTLFSFLVSGEVSFKRFGLDHPFDQGGDHKWNVSQRYLFFNIIPLIFGGRQTVEFRLHTSTFCYEKVALWLYLTSGIVEFAYKYAEDISSFKLNIDKVDLNYIINNVYQNKTADLLVQYIQYRKDIVVKYAQKGDNIGLFDVNEKTDNLNEFKCSLKPLI